MTHTGSVSRHVTFVGPSGSGKTTLLERLLRRLTQRGLNVGFVKHTHHLVEFDVPGKDSWRIREAGADPVLLVTPERCLLQQSSWGSGIDAAFADCDLVLHEGDTRSPWPKVLVGMSAEDALHVDGGPVIASVGGCAVSGVPSFERDDVQGVASFLSAYACRGVEQGASPMESPRAARVSTPA